MLLIDLETQSLPVESGIYEVACLAVEDYRIVDHLYLSKEIDGYFAPRSYGYGYHDISQEDEYIIQFQRFLSRYPYPLIAHNCPFDKKFLLYYGWVDEDYPFYCSMRAIRRENGALKSYAMGELVKHFGIAETTDHQAMSDVENLYKLLRLVRPQEWVPVGVSASSQSNSQQGTGKRKRKSPPKPKPRAIGDIDLPIPDTDILAGESVCFTGKSDYQRHIMQEVALKNGAQISNNVTSKTTLLVVGLNAGARKLDSAQERGIPIISDEYFMDMLSLSNRAEKKTS